MQTQHSHVASPRARRKPSLVGRWYVAFYLARQRTLIKLAVAVAVLSLLLALARPFYSPLPPWLLAVSIVGALASVATSVARSLRDFEASDLTVIPSQPSELEAFLKGVTLPEQLVRSGYELLTGGFAKNIFDGSRFEGTSASSPELNRQLYSLAGDGPLSFKVSVPFQSRTSLLGRYRTWPLPRLARQILPRTVSALKAQERTLENAAKIRLCEDLLVPLSLPQLTIERTDYVADVATAQVTGTHFADRNMHSIYNGYDFAYAIQGTIRTLRLCRESSCSNQIGVSSLAVAVSRERSGGSYSLNGTILLVQQAKGNVQSHGLLAPSGSGSLDWSDFTEFGDSFVTRGMMRELLEETWKGSWEPLTTRDGISSVLTGFGRMLHRGGKPEFYGLAVMPRKRHERGIDPSEVGFVRGFTDIAIPELSAVRMLKALQEFTDKNRGALSHPLFLCLRFAQQYLTDRPEHFDKLVQKAGAAI